MTIIHGRQDILAEETRLPIEQFVILARAMIVSSLGSGIVLLAIILISKNTGFVAIAGFALAIAFVAYMATLLVKAKRTTAGVFFFMLGTAIVMTVCTLITSGLSTVLVMMGVFYVLIVALFLSLTRIWPAAIISLALVLVSSVLESWIPWPRFNLALKLPLFWWLVNVISVAIAAYLINLLGKMLLNTLRSSQKYAGELEQSRTALLERTTELETASKDLAQRSQELEKLNVGLQTTARQAERRAAQLAARGQVTRAASQIRDLDQLLPEVTRLISQAFGYYHVGIFMTDETGRYAVLRAANSEGGQRMLARGHKLAVGAQGMVGDVVSTGQPRVALDVGADAAHFDHPDLPETRSEIALPLQASGRTFGALDVQSTQEAAFAEEDVAILSMMADQVAIAIDNARLFAQTQSALREAEETQRHYLRQEWERLMPALQATSHEYHASGVPPVGNAALPEIEQVIQKGDVVTVTSSSQAAARSALAVPIKLRDQLIGVIDLHETEAEREWTADDVALVTAVADQAALALENARLLEQTEQRARREQLVTQIATKVRIAADVEGILRTGVQEIRRVLGASHGIVHLTTESLVSKTGEARTASAESQESNSEVVTP